MGAMAQTVRRLLLSAAVCAAFVGFLFVPAVASAQTADEVIAKNIAAKGGVEKLKAVQTLRQTGRIDIQPGMSATVTISAKRPNMSRQEISIMGQTIVMMFDGKAAWMINPMMGSAEPQPAPEAQVEMIKDQSNFDGDLVDYKAKGHTAEFVGEETVDGKKVLHVRLSRKALPVQDYYFDAATFLETKLSTDIPSVGKTEINFGDFRQVEGLTMPFSVKNIAQGVVVATITFDKIEINPKLDDAIFRIK
jgi:outer membrane lipoprotein-sorting protein